MSLGILAVIVIFGIAAVVAAVHWTGGSRRGRFEDERAARQVFLLEFPDAHIVDVRLTLARDAAFMRLASGHRMGFAQVFGTHFLTRDIGPADLIAPVTLDHASVTIRARDFTWTGGRFVFATTTDAADVARWCPHPAPGVPRLHFGKVPHG